MTGRKCRIGTLNPWVGVALSIFLNMSGISPVLGQPSDISSSVNVLLDSLAYYRMQDPARVLTLGKRILSRFPENGNERIHFKVALECTNAMKMQSNFNQAIEYSDHAIKMASKLKDNELLIHALFSKATVFNASEITDSTIIYYQKVIEHSARESASFDVCNAYTGIGSAYWFLKNYPKAEEYLLKGVDCSRGLSDEIRTFTLAPLVQFYIETDNPRYLIFLDTLSSTEFFRNPSSLSLMNHFDTFLMLEDSPAEEKEQRLTEVVQYHVEHNRPLNAQVYFAIMLASHLHKVEKWVTAEMLLKEMLAKVQAENLLQYEVRILKALYTNSKGRKDLDDIVHYSERLIDLNQKIHEDENRIQIHELNVKFETAQKDQQIAHQGILLQQQNRNRNSLIALLVLTSALSIITYFYLRNRVRSARKITAQNTVIHNQEIVHLKKEKEFAAMTAGLKEREHERNRIARDLHDEIGSTLSSIHVYSSAAKKAMGVTPDVTNDILTRINQSAHEVMENMSDIVWAINPGRNGELTLEHKLKNYGYELLTPQGINCVYKIDSETERQLSHIEARKNILLISKEAMHNMAKHSKATEASINFGTSNGVLLLRITDNGKGFTPEKKGSGNGLFNMQRRTEALGGTFELSSREGGGTTIECRIPITSIRDAWTEDHA